MKRVELACHTGYSRMNGIGLGGDWADFAVENNIGTLVVTDTGNVDAYVDLEEYIEWKSLDVKLVMGADLFVFDDRSINCGLKTTGRLSVLIKNETGRKNLYKILSIGERKFKDNLDEPQIPLSLLLENREGLLIGTGSENGLICSALENSDSAENIFKNDVYGFCDYVELPYDESNITIDDLMRLADFYKIPAAATCAPHYMTNEDGKAYSILKMIERDSCKYYRTTDEMIERFLFLGKDRAYETVVTNTNIIADSCEAISALCRDKIYYPYIKNQDAILRGICEKALSQKYTEVTDDIRKRLDFELKSIELTRSAFMFIQLKEVIEELQLLPFEVIARYCTAESIVAYLCGISEIDPIKAKLNPYFLFGFEGSEEPYLDLCFSEEMLKPVKSAFSEASGVGNAIIGSSFITIPEEKASELIDKYSVSYYGRGFDLDRNEIIETLTKCISSREVDPSEVLLLPKGTEITEIFPVICVNNGTEIVETAAWSYLWTYGLYKMDVLPFHYCKMLKKLYNLTGADPRNIDTADLEVMEMFNCEDGNNPICVDFYPFNNEYFIKAMRIAKCQTFDDLVKLNGLVHGVGTWGDNFEKLITEGTVSLYDIPAHREDMYDVLISLNFSEEEAFKIADEVWAGNVQIRESTKWKLWKEELVEHKAPEWLIQYCEEILYQYPKSDSYSCMMSAWRIAWYKLHFPLEYYTTILEIYYKDSFTASFYV